MTKPLLFLGLVAGLVLAACGDTTIDSGKLEAEIKEDAGREGLVLDAASCPSRDAKEGDRFTCTVTVKGEKRELEVVQRNDDGNVEYDLTPLLEFSSGNDAGGDEAAVSFVIDAVNKDVTALCDYATGEYSAQIAEQSGKQSCARAIASEDDDPIEDYRVAVEGDTATVVGTDSNGERTVTLERQRDGSWLIARVE